MKYKGMAVQAPNQEFNLWEYDQGPLGPTEVEINVSNAFKRWHIGLGSDVAGRIHMWSRQ